MKKTTGMLAVVITLFMMVSIGTLDAIRVEAAGDSTCSPHGPYVERHQSSSDPRTDSHEILKYNIETNTYEYVGDCTYSYQCHTIAMVCIKCRNAVSTYPYRTEIHQNPACEKYHSNN